MPERIIDKAWIAADGTLIHHGLGTSHQEWAVRHLRGTKGFRRSGNLNRDMLRAERALLGRGWIRVQYFEFGGLGLNGSTKALKARGHVALRLLPRPRRVYRMVWPTNQTGLFLPKQYAGIGLCHPKAGLSGPRRQAPEPPPYQP